jgi:hypothetical protein
MYTFAKSPLVPVWRISHTIRSLRVGSQPQFGKAEIRKLEEAFPQSPVHALSMLMLHYKWTASIPYHAAHSFNNRPSI